MPSPFYKYRNSILDFEVESDSSDVLDSSGNPQPDKVTLRIEAFLKPVKNNRLKNHIDYPGLGLSELLLDGYIVTPEKFPNDIKLMDKTIYAKYRDQEGEFIRTINLQSCVGADRLTGYPIAGIFRIVGGM